MKNRIVEHVKVKASEIIPHELNFRTHSSGQKAALAKLYEEVGFARSLLAYRLPDGRLKLIDGHLRQSMDPDEEVVVEVLDVNDQEARTLLLAIDPLAQLAENDNEILAKLLDVTKRDSEAIAQLWGTIEAEEKEAKSHKEEEPIILPERYSVIVDCETEAQQTSLWRKLKAEGYQCQMKTV